MELHTKFADIKGTNYRTVKLSFKMPRKKETSLSDFKYHSVNPFLDKVVEHLETKKTSKRVGFNWQDVVNLETGEVEKQHIMFLSKQKEVDKREFVKIYYGQIKEFHGLSESALKLIDYIVENIRYSHDRICLTVSDIIEQKNLGYTTVYRSLSQLLDKKILAKADKIGCYFINPQIFFKGDTITLINQYIKKDKKTQPIKKIT
jgi:predicted transcriptional regulator